MGELMDNQKGYQIKFFLFSFHPWNFKSSFNVKPKVNKFNNNALQCTLDEVVIIEYAQMTIE